MLPLEKKEKKCEVSMSALHRSISYSSFQRCSTFALMLKEKKNINEAFCIDAMRKSSNGHFFRQHDGCEEGIVGDEKEGEVMSKLRKKVHFL